MFSVLLVFLEPTFSAEETLSVSLSDSSCRTFPLPYKHRCMSSGVFFFDSNLLYYFSVLKGENALRVSKEKLVWDCTVPVEGILGLWWGSEVMRYFFVELIARVPFPPSAVLGFCFSAVHRWNCHHIL